MKTYNSIIFSFIVILFACKKNDVATITPPPSPETVNASVAGKITDIYNDPVSGASVEAGGSTTTTDANGQFTLKDVQLDKDAGLVKVTKAGNFTGSRTFLVNGNTTNNIKIQMLPKTVSGNIASSSGGNVDVTGGAKINFKASSFVNASSNSVYSGNVAVAGFYLNPADANFREYMPGDLRGINTANKAGILKSFGMLSIEMNDAGGQKLQLGTGKTASITIPIPSTMQAAAPATIPLWYLDETTGIWKQEGTATKQNNTYTGAVTHFSFWTAAQLSQSVRLDATFKDSSGNALDNKQVFLTISGSGADSTVNTTEGYTNSAGTVSGLVPVDTKLLMKVAHQYGVIYSQLIGPFATDVNLGVITINNIITVTLSGTVVDCNNNPVSKGSVNVSIPADNYQFSSEVTNGTFTTTFDRPNSSPTTATILVVDKSTAISATMNVTVTRGNLNLGQIKACTTSATAAGFTYTVSGPYVPVTVSFTNKSTNATSWIWDFGDGATSSVQNPVHTYSSAGDYTVKLLAKGTTNSDSTFQVLHLVDQASTAPVANFNYSVSGSFVPVTVTFSNTSTNATASMWNFGDGTISTATNPSHTYSTAGDYTVTLIVTSAAGKTDSTSKTLHLISQSDSYINLSLKGVNYTWSPSNGLDAYYFTDSLPHRTYILGGSPPFYFLGAISNNNTLSPGSFPFSLYTVINGTAYNTNFSNNNPQITVTEYGSVGGYITGSASGLIRYFQAATDSSFAFSCTFRVKRTK